MLRAGMLGLIRFYQAFLSPLMPLGCRFHPSCSHYAYQAIERHGARRGVWLAARRLLRCRPFGPYGYDPVPHVKNETPCGAVQEIEKAQAEGLYYRQEVAR